MNANAETIPATLLDAYWPRTRGAGWVRSVILAVAGSALLALSAKISVPMWPVPVSMQTFAVLLIGAAYGWRLAGLTVALYLAEGIAGLPVFTKGAGIAYFFGPTGGYLVGFLFAAMLVGWLAERGWDRFPASTAAAMLFGNLVIYAFGLLWLHLLFGLLQPVDDWNLGRTIAAGMTPFLVGDAIKIALAAAVFPLAWQLLNLARRVAQQVVRSFAPVLQALKNIIRR